VVRCVLFDLDDTLFDLRHSIQSGLAAIQQEHRSLQQKTLAQLHRDYLRLINEFHPRVLQGLLSLPEARLERLRQLFVQYGEEVSATDLETAAECYHQGYLAARRPVPGVLPLLEALRLTARIGVVTNNLVSEQRSKLQACHLDHLIDALVVSEAVGVTKPHPAIFRAALDQLGCASQQAVMVGDSWQTDILGARQAGIRAVWLNRYEIPCPDPALASEINAFEPLNVVLPVMLDDRG
jgi:HAD superfamily hydrolase (TIGR01509 family)